jgi:hypothetical protein
VLRSAALDGLDDQALGAQAVFNARQDDVSGAVRNKIIPERLFVKSYIQLAEADDNPKLRSNVLYIDRLAHPDVDLDEVAGLPP